MLALTATTASAQSNQTRVADESINRTLLPQPQSSSVSLLPALQSAPAAIQNGPRKAIDESATWTSLGMGTYREDIMTTFYTVDNVSYKVEVQECDSQKGLFRLVNPYGAAYPYNEDGYYDATQDYYLYIDATVPDSVYVIGGEQGLDWGQGMMSTTSLVDYYITNFGYDLADLQLLIRDYFGLYEDGVITMPAQGMVISLADYNSGDYYYANNNGMFAIALPGYELAADYSLSFYAYDGTVFDDEGNTYARGTLTLGADVATVRYAAVSADADVDAVAADIKAGTVSYDEATASDGILIPCSATGSYYLVCVVYDENATAIRSYSFAFDHTHYEGNWNKVVDGTFSHFVSDLSASISSSGSAWGSGIWDDTSYQTVLYQNDVDRTLFCIAPWLGWDEQSLGLVFNCDTTDGSIAVDGVDTALRGSGNVAICVYDLYDSYPSVGSSYASNYDAATGTFSFNLLYYSPSSNGVYAAQLDTFVASGTVNGIQGVTADAASDGTTTIYDVAGRAIYTAPTAQFSLDDVPANGLLIVKSGAEVRKMMK